MSPPAVTSSYHSVQDSQESFNPTPLETQQKKSQNARKRPGSAFYRAWVTDWWLAELISLAFGTVAMVAVVILLLYYQNRHVPGLNSFLGVSITLNTIIALLGTIGRASLLYAVTECICQQRWAWFSGPPRLLTDLESFDQGSRGAWGSLLLIWKLRVRHFVSLGAFILIFALAVDPLSQQLVNYNLVSQVDSSGFASVARAQAWNTGDYLIMKDILSYYYAEPPLYMKAAVSSGLFATNIVLNEIEATCSTGNCTWQSYHSLAVCSRWKNVTDHLKYTNITVSQFADDTNTTTIDTPTYTWSLSDYNYIQSTGHEGYYFNVSSAAYNTSAMGFSPQISFRPNNTATIACTNCTWPLADIFVIYRDNNRSPISPQETFIGITDENAYSAMELILEWCIVEYNTTLTKGISSTTRTTQSFFTANTTNDTNPYLNASVAGAEYAIDFSAHLSLATHLYKTFQGYTALQRTEWFTNSDAAEALFSYFAPSTGNQTWPSNAEISSRIDKGLQNIAVSMSNAVRTARLAQISANAWPTVANGTAWRDQAVVNVQWGWIAAPILLFVLSVIFVLVTIIQSRMHAGRYSIWKSSALATLLSLSDDTHQRVSGIESISEMENKLNSTRASLTRDPDGKWRL